MKPYPSFYRISRFDIRINKQIDIGRGSWNGDKQGRRQRRHWRM